MPPLFLASRSPRRADLLRQLGLDFEVLEVEVEERRAAGETPAEYVSRTARDKALAGLRRLSAGSGGLVLGADTEVVLDGEVFGKPGDAAAAAGMLQRLSGRCHRVLSAVCCAASSGIEAELSESTVEFAELDESAIEAYVASGEPFGKAGGYAIQGRAAAFIRRLEGSYSGVVGLPLHETTVLLKRFGAG